MQRFQLAVWPDLPSTWENIDRFPDAAARDVAYAALQRLVLLSPVSPAYEQDSFDPNGIPFVHFDADAQPIFDSWRAELEGRLRAGDLHPALESHLAKYRSLIPSLALIIQLVDAGPSPVSVAAIRKAISWGRYLESHARRMYTSVTNAPAVAARLLAKRIEAGEVADHFAARDVYRNGWAGLDKDRTEAAIDVLLSLGWLEERIEPTPGRQRTRYAINPKVCVCPRNPTDKTAKSPVNDPFVSSVSTHSGDIPKVGGVD
jgi:Protein of unknown function (DUF3987)